MTSICQNDSAAFIKLVDVERGLEMLKDFSMKDTSIRGLYEGIKKNPQRWFKIHMSQFNKSVASIKKKYK